MTAPQKPWRARYAIKQFGSHRATTAIELAFVFFPFIYVLLVIIQMGIYYMTQSALDAGVNTTAAGLRTAFSDFTTQAATPSAATLKTEIAQAAGGLVTADSLAVEIRQLSSLSGGAVAVADGTTDYGTASTQDMGGTPLALRATSSVIVFAPGFSGYTKVESAAIIRH